MGIIRKGDSVKKRVLLGVAACCISFLGCDSAQPVSTVENGAAGLAAVNLDASPYRVGISHDGNQHDADDINAAPFGLALMAEAGLKGKLVHFDYACHLGDNNESRYNALKQNVEEAASRWNISSSVIFDDQTELSASVNNIASEINASSASDRFYLCEGGPTEVVYRGIKAANSSKRQYVTVVTHSGWNDYHTDTGQLNHTIDDIKKDFPSVEVIHIPDQNRCSDTNEDFKSPVEKWTWLKNSNNANWQWLWNEIAEGKARVDVSDAGMLFYVITGRGDECGGPSDVREIFEGNTSSDPIDSDNDGVADSDDNCPNTPNADQTDSDGDGVGDACDNDIVDSDGDGIADTDDNCPYVANADQADSDGDGVGDACEGTGDGCKLQAEYADVVTGDVQGDVVKLGNDESYIEWSSLSCAGNLTINFEANRSSGGISVYVNGSFKENVDALTSGHLHRVSTSVSVTTGDKLVLRCYAGEGSHFVDYVEIDDGGSGSTDSDGDGVADEIDNCPNTANADQTDSDGDGIGDACDNDPVDSDGDGVADDVDNCPNTANADQTDSDGDGVGDACDNDPVDSDGDGVADDVDNCPNTANADQADSDGDGVGDACDSDGGGTGTTSRYEAENAEVLQGGGSFSKPCGSGQKMWGTGMYIEWKNVPAASNIIVGVYESGSQFTLKVNGQSRGTFVESGGTDCYEINTGISTSSTSTIRIEWASGTNKIDYMDVVTDGSSSGSDSDGDGVEDGSDNCPNTVNADQADTDADGIGDVCDACPDDAENDIDGDGVCGDVDNCPTIANANQADSDGDGIGDACESTGTGCTLQAENADVITGDVQGDEVKLSTDDSYVEWTSLNCGGNLSIMVSANRSSGGINVYVNGAFVESVDAQVSREYQLLSTSVVLNSGDKLTLLPYLGEGSHFVDYVVLD